MKIIKRIKCFFKGHDYEIKERIISGIHSKEALQLIKTWEALSGESWGSILQLVNKYKVCKRCGKNKGFVGFGHAEIKLINREK